MATLGDPLADLALHVVYRDPAFDAVLGGAAASDRMPDPDRLVQRYALGGGSRHRPAVVHAGAGMSTSLQHCLGLRDARGERPFCVSELGVHDDHPAPHAQRP